MTHLNVPGFLAFRHHDLLFCEYMGESSVRRRRCYRHASISLIVRSLIPVAESDFR